MQGPASRGPEGFWTIGSKVYHPQAAANRTIDINLASNPFADLAGPSNRGFFIQRAGGQALMERAEAVAAV